jgi:hypothetical protein
MWHGALCRGCAWQEDVRHPLSESAFQLNARDERVSNWCSNFSCISLSPVAYIYSLFIVRFLFVFLFSLPVCHYAVTFFGCSFFFFFFFFFCAFVDNQCVNNCPKLFSPVYKSFLQHNHVPTVSKNLQ